MELLLLVFFCLLTGSEVTFGAGTKVTVDKGSDVTLPCSLREDITNKKFVWKKDGRQVFLYDAGDHSNNVPTGQDQQFIGRVSYFLSELKSGNASITIIDMKEADRGEYTCEFPDLQPSQKFYMKLLIAGGNSIDPNNHAEVGEELIKGKKNIRVEKGSDVILPCSLNTTDLRQDTFVWKKDGHQMFKYNYSIISQPPEQFRGRVEHFPDELKSGDASIIIIDMKVVDTGVYTCTFPKHPEEIFLIQLVVDDIYRAEIRGVAKPSVRILKQTKFNAVLQCEVQGAFPKPELHWQDGAEKILPAEEPQETERGGHYDIILITNVTKTDYYRCVATQKEINKMTHYETHVYIHGSASGLVAGSVLKLFFLMVFLVFLF